jgi:hypothetical protein
MKRLTDDLVALAREHGRPGCRKLKPTDVIDVLSGLFILRGVPEHKRACPLPLSRDNSGERCCGTAADCCSLRR